MARIIYQQSDNSLCLAQKGACFACIDHCPAEAVNIALGLGIFIDIELCHGCGECAVVCPMKLKVIMMTMSAEATNPRERRIE